ncbi:MAG: retropepsin-like domain-containing protein [Acidobacteriota bacterium]|nr:retropepsin-like domain-containing protein [Acidobacteriota bacterium]
MSESLELRRLTITTHSKRASVCPLFCSQAKTFLEINAKLDTGASHCIFERNHAELLNLDIESGEPTIIGTATGKFHTFEHRITLITFGLSWEATVCFIAEEGIKRNILGRQGWLDRVKLGLIDYEGKLFLNSYFDNY